MNLNYVFVFICLALVQLNSEVNAQATGNDSDEKAVTSRVEKVSNGDLILIQEASVNASVEKVWDAYTTKAGWQAWVAPVAEVDLKVGGTILTNYRVEGKVTDPDANTLHIVNYVPRRLLTLQAEVTDNWPEILKEQEKQLYNVIVFEPLEENRTKVYSYGTGYKDSPELNKLMQFYIPANEKTLQKLIEHVEK